MKLQLFDKDDQTTVVVTLSQRNLLTLLHKLTLPWSLRMLYTQYCERDGRLDDDLLLVVRVEDDEEHYGKRGFGPGPMLAATEMFIAAAKSANGGNSRAESAVDEDDQPDDQGLTT